MKIDSGKLVRLFTRALHQTEYMRVTGQRDEMRYFEYAAVVSALRDVFPELHNVVLSFDGAGWETNIEGTDRAFPTAASAVAHITSYLMAWSKKTSTGLFDSREVEIREGDTLQYRDGLLCITGTVTWAHGHFWCDGQPLHDLQLKKYWTIQEE